MTIDIQVDGFKVDVSEITKPIAATYQVSDFDNFGGVLTSYTNRISLPNTVNNRNVLKLADSEHIITDTPYKNLGVRIVQAGRLVLLGICQVVDKNDQEIKLDVQGRLKNFFETIRGKYLTDLDFSAYNGIWDDNARDFNCTNSGGLMAILIDTGQLDRSNPAYLNLYTYGDANIPFFGYQTIIEKILFYGGVVGQGDVFLDTNRFQKLAVSTNLGYHENFLKRRYGKAFFLATAIVLDTVIGTSEVKADFTSAVQGDGNYVDVANDKYVVLEGPVSGYFKAKIEVRGTIFIVREDDDIDNYVELRLKINGSIVAIAGPFTYTTETPFISPDINYTAILKNGDYIEVYAYANNITGDGDISITVDGYIEVNPIKTTDTVMSLSGGVYRVYSDLMPRILLTDFIRDFMILFGLQAKETIGNIIEFSHIETNLNTLATKELENTEVEPGEESYAVSGLSKLNYFRWHRNEMESATLGEDFGEGVNDEIPNVLLNDSQILHEFNFSMSPHQGYNAAGHTVANFKIYDAGGAGFIKAGSYGTRLLMFRTSNSGKTVRYKAGTDKTNVFKVGYFIDPYQTYSLDLQQHVDTFYREYFKLFHRYLSTYKTLFVSDAVIQTMNVLTPKIIGKTSYIIKKISNYIAGLPTKVYLIRK